MSIDLLDNAHLFKTEPGYADPRLVTISKQAGSVEIAFRFSAHRHLRIFRQSRSWAADRSVALAGGGRYHQTLRDPKLHGSQPYTDMELFSSALMPWFEDEFGVLEAELALAYVRELAFQAELHFYNRGVAEFPVSDYFDLRIL